MRHLYVATCCPFVKIGVSSGVPEPLEHLQPRPHCQVQNDKKQHHGRNDAHMAPAHGVQPLNSWAAVSISSPALLCATPLERLIKAIVNPLFHASC